MVAAAPGNYIVDFIERWKRGTSAALFLCQKIFFFDGFRGISTFEMEYNVK